MLKWGSFIKEKDGEWDGLNNAAIYSFNSNIINSFVREMFQNSIDARDKNLSPDPKTEKIPPLKIRINYKEILQNEFPDFNGFYGIFKKIAGSQPNKQHAKFFNNAFKVLGDKRKIPLFVFEDYNTYGLSGSDDDPESSFNACVISEGISVNKDATSGGSFGIGKNAIYGLSSLRTVFYSSLDTSGNYIFQGKSKLASYYDDNGKTREHKIYCGEKKDFRSIRDIKSLSDSNRQIFYRDQPGLSQYAVCPIENDNWPEEFVKAILRNYWMLLEKGELEVELLQQDKLSYVLAKNSLEKLMTEFFSPENYEPEDISPKGNPFEYYNCYKNGTCIQMHDLGQLGNVRFFYNEIADRNTNAIAYLRNDMVVYAKSVHGFGSIGYCGVFMCDSNQGNEILRAMEPPTHDSFSPDRLQEKLEGYSSSDGREILNQIRLLVKSGLQTIVDKYTKPVEDIPWLDNLLSSLKGAAGIGAGDRTNEESENETTEKIGKDVKKKLTFSSQNRNSLINDDNGEIEDNGSGDPAPGPGPRPPRPEPRPGPKPGPKPIKKAKIRSRIFKTGKEKKIGSKKYASYRIHLTSEREIQNADIVISQQGDTGNVGMFEIGDVFVLGGPQLDFSEEKNKQSEIIAYRIKSLTVPSVIEFYVNEPYKSSFKLINL